MILMIVILVLCVLNTMMIGYVVFNDLAKEHYTRSEKEIEEELKKSADWVDEGFDNIMGFQVRGMSGYEISKNAFKGGEQSDR